MYFFNQGQALEQYYISTRQYNSKLIHIRTSLTYKGVQLHFAPGWQMPFPLRVSGG